MFRSTVGNLWVGVIGILVCRVQSSLRVVFDSNRPDNCHWIFGTNPSKKKSFLRITSGIWEQRSLFLNNLFHTFFQIRTDIAIGWRNRTGYTTHRRKNPSRVGQRHECSFSNHKSVRIFRLHRPVIHASLLGDYTSLKMDYSKFVKLRQNLSLLEQ